MSAAPIERAVMPAQITLDDVAAMAEADSGHKYELTPEGTLLVMTPPTVEHQKIVVLLILWLGSHGYKAGQLLPEVGVYTGGGCQPDLTVWADVDAARPEVSAYCGTNGLLLAVEVVSRSSEIEDKVRKRAEYARASIPRYWIIEQDKSQTVIMYRLGDDGAYLAALPSPQPLSWVLTTDPAAYLGPRTA